MSELGNELLLLFLPPQLSIELYPALGLSVGVQFDQEAQIRERILLANSEASLSPGRAKVASNFIGRDDTRQIGIGKKRAGQVVVNLGLGRLGVGSVEGIKPGEGILGPDAEATKVTSGGELQKVETLHTCQLNTRNVSVV